jgi:hypothetical protein
LESPKLILPPTTSDAGVGACRHQRDRHLCGCLLFRCHLCIVCARSTMRCSTAVASILLSFKPQSFGAGATSCIALHPTFISSDVDSLIGVFIMKSLAGGRCTHTAALTPLHSHRCTHTAALTPLHSHRCTHTRSTAHSTARDFANRKSPTNRSSWSLAWNLYGNKSKARSAVRGVARVHRASQLNALAAVLLVALASAPSDISFASRMPSMLGKLCCVYQVHVMNLRISGGLSRESAMSSRKIIDIV